VAVLRPDPPPFEETNARHHTGGFDDAATGGGRPAGGRFDAAGDASVIAEALLTVEGVGDRTDELYPDSPGDRPTLHVRLFGTHEFFRLWLVQVVSSMGDWLGLSAIIVLASRVGGAGGAGAISLVMAARIIPGFFFGPMAGVLVDRWDRKRVMVVCDLGRATVVALLPFVDNLAGLVLASLVLEVFTLLWSPAKDATVPNLVPPEHLTSANSLSLAAAYGTFPFAALLFALLAGVSDRLAGLDAFGALELDQMSLALYVDVATFLFAALMVRSLPIPRRQRTRVRQGTRRADLANTLAELKEGWHFIFLNHTVRAVNVGLATGLIGGGMLIPLGAVYAAEVLDAGDGVGYGLFTTALGFGVATGAILVSVFQKRLPKAAVFTVSLLVAGAALFVGASSSRLGLTVAAVFVMGVFVGPVYVIGFVLLQEEVNDDLRGRVFSSLNTLVRLCVLLAMIVGPLLAATLGRVSESLTGGEVEVGALTIALPGVRLALWLASLIIVGAGLLAWHALRSGQREQASRQASHPSRHGLALGSRPPAQA
jgi:dTMP kinase